MKEINVENSVCVVRVAYAHKEEKLFIQFRSGKCYEYQNVPANIWKSLRDAIRRHASIGKWVSRYLRNRPCVKQEQATF